jgi:hypothetical protein
MLEVGDKRRMMEINTVRRKTYLADSEIVRSGCGRSRDIPTHIQIIVFGVLPPILHDVRRKRIVWTALC